MKTEDISQWCGTECDSVVTLLTYLCLHLWLLSDRKQLGFCITDSSKVLHFGHVFARQQMLDNDNASTPPPPRPHTLSHTHTHYDWVRVNLLYLERYKATDDYSFPFTLIFFSRCSHDVMVDLKYRWMKINTVTDKQNFPSHYSIIFVCDSLMNI